MTTTYIYVLASSQFSYLYSYFNLVQFFIYMFSFNDLMTFTQWFVLTVFHSGVHQGVGKLWRGGVEHWHSWEGYYFSSVWSLPWIWFYSVLLLGVFWPLDDNFFTLLFVTTSVGSLIWVCGVLNLKPLVGHLSRGIFFGQLGYIGLTGV